MTEKDPIQVSGLEVFFQPPMATDKTEYIKRAKKLSRRSFLSYSFYQNIKGKVKSLYEPSGPSEPELIPVSLA